MNIGWLIRAGGIFGSVREAMETGNALTRRGHSFTMYTDEGKDLKWLPNTLKWKHTKFAATDPLDVLIWSDNPDEPYRSVFERSRAPLKAYCMMGFDPANKFTSILRDLMDRHWFIMDGNWQREHLTKYCKRLGPAIGGVNLTMFRPVKTPYEWDVVWSGDTRDRKGGKYVLEAIEGMNAGNYFKKKTPQNKMAEFLCKAPVFADGHFRGGWCNPVMEAMACGRVVVCTDTPCNSDFAIDGYNCIKVPVRDSASMKEAINSLLGNEVLMKEIQKNALDTASKYSYDKVCVDFEQWALSNI